MRMEKFPMIIEDRFDQLQAKVRANSHELDKLRQLPLGDQADVIEDLFSAVSSEGGG